MANNKRSISVRLLKDHIVDPADALKEDHPLQEIVLDPAPGNKRLFAGQAYRNPPKWHSFFNPNEAAQLRRLTGAQAAAVLFVSVENGVLESRIHWLAICFGMGFQAIRPEVQESRFGLRVALNRLGRQMIKSVDTRRPEDATIQTRSQNSRSGEIFDFGVDTSHIILQAITGKSVDEDFGGTMSGADALKLSCEVNYDLIDEKAAQIIQAFDDESFRDVFPWYGNITPVRDLDEITRLDQTLCTRLEDSDLDGIHLAPPEIIEYQHIEMFKFSGEGRAHEGYDELRLVDYLRLFDTERSLTLANLKSDKVRVKPDDQERFFDRWSVYSCVSAELSMDGTLYVLAAGNWYGVVSEFVERINEIINSIPTTDLGLPGHRNGESEGEYNIRAAAEVTGLHFFDRTLIQFEGERGRVEFCDLLSNEGHIIHVKKRSRSALLSHLFMQAYVAAEAFFEYPAMRQQIRDHMSDLGDLIPEGQPDPTDYEIVFAILYETEPQLPFFSKVALNSIYKQLRRMRYRASISWVRIQNDMI